MRRSRWILWSTLGVAAVAGMGGVALDQNTVPAGPNRVAYPADWAQGVMYATVDRPDTKQYREFWTSAQAVQAAREGRPIPDGTLITLAAYAARLDGAGVPVKDANGRFVKDKLVAVNVMQKKAGWGQDIPAALRNGDWIYQSFAADGQVNDKANLTACYQCHLPFQKDDYLTNLAKLAGRFPTQAAAAPAAAPGQVGIANFAFGPDNATVKVGQKVTWLNADDTPHQITVVGSGQRSEVMLKGQSATMQFDAEGNIAYICGLHPTMKGTLTVTR
jgi:plastocyanin